MNGMAQGKRSGRARLVRFILLFVLFGWGLAPGTSRALAMQSGTAPTPGVPGLAVVALTAASINTTPPPETVLSVDLPASRAQYPGCMRVPEAPEVNYKTDQLSLTDIAIISTCGWQPDEVIKITVMEPNGRLSSTEVKASPSKYLKHVYQADFFYQPGADAQQGKYRFTLQGSRSHTGGNAIKANLFFNPPGVPRLYVVSEDRFQPQRGAMGGQLRLRLNGFLAHEPVRLLAYRFEGSRIQFTGWQDVTTDANGQLMIETNLPEIGPEVEMNYFAYGRETHFVQLERFTPEGLSKTRRFNMDLYCPGALAPRLSVPADLRSGAIQPAAGLEKLDIQQQPGYGSRLLAQISPGTPLRVYGYPKCIDRAFWWPVALSKPARFGWVAESFSGQYRVEPVITPAP